MKFLGFFKNIVQDYFLILGIVISILTLLNIDSNFALSGRELVIIMLAVLLSDLLSFIFYSKRELSEKEYRIRMVVHFILLEVLLITLILTLGYITYVWQVGVFFVEIAVIYALVKLFNWKHDKMTAAQINVKLMAMRQEDEE
jgi:membrane-associated HD superfamily phosphohydrolase